MPNMDEVIMGAAERRIPANVESTFGICTNCIHKKVCKYHDTVKDMVVRKEIDNIPICQYTLKCDVFRPIHDAY